MQSITGLEAELRLAAPLRSRPTVLVTDDEPMVRRAVAEALRDSGYHVLEARDGGEALELAETHPGPIHLLLTDVMMPGIDGPELAARLRRRRPRTRILFMSADPAESLAGTSPAAPTLGKPFVLDELDHAVRTALARSTPLPAP